MTRLKKIPQIISLILLVLVVPLYAWKTHLKTDYTDFSVYWRAALRFSEAQWELVYSLADGASPFRYAPVSLPLFLPFAVLPLPAAQSVWYFCQVLFFLGGFALLFRTLQTIRASRREAAAITSISALFVLRFCLDTFTIGQVSSLMFLGFAASLYGWVHRRFALAGAGLFVPALLKIGPAFLYALFFSGRKRARTLVLSTSFWIFAALNILLLGILAFRGDAWSLFSRLWFDWKAIVLADSLYYDASHYGSQSLNSVLLRFAKLQWIDASSASLIHFWLMFLGCGAMLAFWFLRRPKSPLGRGLFFSLGLFPYLWFMPETFKYSLTVLAFPIGFLSSSFLKSPPHSPHRRFLLATLVFGFLTLSLAGKDIVGDPLFFGLQKLSVPFLATVFLGIATWIEAIRESTASPIGRTVLSILAMRSIGPWRTTPELQPSKEISFLIPIRLTPESLRGEPESRAHVFATELCAFLDRLAPQSTEILLLPYGNRVSLDHPVLRALTGPFLNRARTLLPGSALADDRAQALQTGFLASRGSQLAIVPFEQPCDLEFFSRAREVIRNQPSVHLVRANRRMTGSLFTIPVRLLPIVHGRHRLGLLFNSLVRALLPISTTDSQAGNILLTRELAYKTFALHTSPDFLWDIELALTAYSHGLKSQDLPASFLLPEEKTKARMFRETLHILFGIPFLALRFRRGCYGPSHPLNRNIRITADDWGISPAVNEAILELIELGVLTRTSLMADAKYLDTGLDRLLGMSKKGQVELGLHFNLTYGKLFRSPFEVLKTKRSRYAANECHLQLESLARRGVTAAFFDGHHHVHLVPWVLKAISPILLEKGIRETRLPWSWQLLFSKKFSLALLAAVARRQLGKKGFHYRRFYYPREAAFADPGRFIVELAAQASDSSNELEVIVHPATHADGSLWEYPDTYIEPRVTEYRLLRMLAWVLPKDAHQGSK